MTSLHIRVWADGTACPVDELREGDYSYMSDDYRDVDPSDPVALSYLSDTEVCALAEWLVA